MTAENLISYHDTSYHESVADDPRESIGDVEEAPGKVWFRTLDEAVIEADRCVQCASCVAACPSNSIGIDEAEGRPTLVRMCTGCSSCWDYCPRSGLRYERIIALAEEERGLEEPQTYAARAKPEAVHEAGQDGGVVTALLGDLLDEGVIDGTVVAREREGEPLSGAAALATTREELIDGAGSVYTQTMGLGRIDDLLADAGLDSDADLALVGTPCTIQGASALERYDHGSASPIALTVALFCTRSFEARRLASTVADYGVDPDDVAKLDVSGGVLYALDATGETLLEEDVDAFESAGLRGCDECADFVGAAADVSVGSVGSPDGETTVVIRTPRGERAWNLTTSIEFEGLEETGALDGLERWNRRRAISITPREYDPEGSVGISTAEHREAYDGTDREPEQLNPARVHQYEEWC